MTERRVKQFWTAAEEEAVRAGVAKHGSGKWKAILEDPELNQHFHSSRTNVDIKDKWRNLNKLVEVPVDLFIQDPKPKTKAGEMTEEEALAVASYISQAEHLSFKAEEACKEAEKVDNIAEDAASFLKSVEHLYHDVIFAEKKVTEEEDELDSDTAQAEELSLKDKEEGKVAERAAKRAKDAASFHQILDANFG